jgi:hypothetical protein
MGEMHWLSWRRDILYFVTRIINALLISGNNAITLNHSLVEIECTRPQRVLAYSTVELLETLPEGSGDCADLQSAHPPTRRIHSGTCTTCNLQHSLQRRKSVSLKYLQPQKTLNSAPEAHLLPPRTQWPPSWTPSSPHRRTA